MKRRITTVFFILTVTIVFGQTEKELVRKADSLYQAGNYEKSNTFYKQALKQGMKSSYGLYNAACSASLANDINSSFQFLELAIKNGWTDIGHTKEDTDLKNLYRDKRWILFLNKMQRKVDSVEMKLDKPLRDELLKIWKDDQSTRQKYITTTQKLGYKNKTVDSLVKAMQYTDSIDLIRITKILDTKGWVGKDKVGSANQVFFLVIQHSDLKTQEKYLPMMKEAVKKGNASSSDLALLEDRIALRQGKFQIYGSQIYRNEKTNRFYIAPLADPDNVDKKRTEVGLPSIADYVKQWGIIWNVEEYKKELPELELLSKQNKW